MENPNEHGGAEALLNSIDLSRSDIHKNVTLLKQVPLQSNEVALLNPTALILLFHVHLGNSLFVLVYPSIFYHFKH